jgi:hypothetical protein
MEYSDNQLAAHLNVNRTTAYRWRKLGCPTDDLQAASEWSQNRKPATSRIKNEVVEEVTPIPVVGEDPYSVRDRLQAQEQSISSEISGLNVALQQARAANDEKVAYRLLQALKSAREEHRKQSDCLLKAEGRIILLEKNRGDLISLDKAKDLLSKTINPLAIYLRKLPDHSRNEEERALLVVLSEGGLEVLRSSASEGAGFTGK